MGKSDFQRTYMSVNKYFFASNTSPATQAGTSRQPAAVADPVYVAPARGPDDPGGEVSVQRPTRLLGPVVRSSFPTGNGAGEELRPADPDDHNKLTVPLNDRAAGVGRDTCDEMAAQLLFTVQSLTPVVDEVELRAGGRQVCSLTEDRAETVATRGSAHRPDYLYFVDDRDRLVRIAAGSKGTRAEPVPGALGEGAVGLRSVAVSRDEHSAAAIGLDNKSLYVGSLVTGWFARRARAGQQGQDGAGPADAAELGRPGGPLDRRPRPGRPPVAAAAGGRGRAGRGADAGAGRAGPGGAGGRPTAYGSRSSWRRTASVRCSSGGSSGTGRRASSPPSPSSNCAPPPRAGGGHGHVLGR